MLHANDKRVIFQLFSSVMGECHSGVARAFPGGRLTHPEDENEQSLRKIRKIDRDLRKNEESGTLAHPGQ